SMGYPKRISDQGHNPRPTVMPREKTNNNFATVGALAAIGITLGVLAIIGFANPAGFAAVNSSLSSSATSLVTLGVSALAVPSLYMIAKRVESLVNGKNINDREKKVTAFVLGLLATGFIVTGLVFGGHLIVHSPAYAGALGGSIGLLATLTLENLSKTKYYAKKELGRIRDVKAFGKIYFIHDTSKDPLKALNRAISRNKVYIKENEGYRKLGLFEINALRKKCDNERAKLDTKAQALKSAARPASGLTPAKTPSKIRRPMPHPPEHLVAEREARLDKERELDERNSLPQYVSLYPILPSAPPRYGEIYTDEEEESSFEFV
ncbi:MAG: hypothetical protein JXA94_01565, partial [Parachlamydiales bacterium]|nr:hypothetical protein [Parachlamydiales bacterium]